jgi:hypothetical protein
MNEDKASAADSDRIEWWGGLTEEARAAWLRRLDVSTPEEAWAVNEGMGGHVVYDPVSQGFVVSNPREALISTIGTPAMIRWDIITTLITGGLFALGMALLWWLTSR